MTAIRSPSWTWSLGATLTSVTVPAVGDSTGISIFIDSRMATVSPSAMVWPGSTWTCHTLAVISARTSVTAVAPCSAAGPMYRGAAADRGVGLGSARLVLQQRHVGVDHH